MSVFPFDAATCRALGTGALVPEERHTVTAAEIAERLRAKRSGDGWMCRCPAHDDRNPSLSITTADDGRVLLHCHAGCDFAAIVGALGLTAADLAPPKPTPAQRRLAEIYDYNDGAGKLLYQVCRYIPKDFRQRRPDGQGGWTWSMKGVERVLYRLPDVLRAVAAGEQVYVTEGEKDALALVRLGLCATCNAGGAGKWQDGYSTALKGAGIVILPDRDEPGRKHGELVARALRGNVASLKVIELPDRDGRKVKDAADWIGAGGSRAELEELVEEAPEAAAEADSAPSDSGVLDGAEMLATAPPEHEPVLSGLFDRHALVEIVGPSKTRKSFSVLQLALSLTAGRDVFGFNVPRPFSVLLADLELSEADLRRRLYRMGHALGIGPADVGDRLRVLPLAGQEGLMARIEAAAVGADVVIADPLYALCDGGETIEDLRAPLRWLRRLAVGRAACCFVHHDAKGAAGDRDTRDRGSGSGITGRSVDARVTLTPNAADPANAVVMGFMCRSYVVPEPRALRFNGDCFEGCDLPAEPERSIDRRTKATRPKIAGYTRAALGMLENDGPMSPAVFKRRLRDELNMSKGDADDLTAALCEPDGGARRWREGGFTTAYQIGTAGQAESAAPASPASRLLPGKQQEAG